mmetsp:Transcript_18070/g.59527  ORF Transcript_18070/g.59527 Transcript_18070/m.59527 type:complete len:536 (+) Transcript_18070:52-1659(+)
MKAAVPLFFGHWLSAWGDRMWQFATPVLFMDIFLDTLAPAALYGVAVYTVCVFGIPAAGAWIDRQERLRVMRITFIVNNLCVVGSACLMPALSNAVLSQDWGPELVYAVFAGIILLGCVGEVMNQAQTLALERDWVPTMCDGDSALLTHLNTTMRRIDLSAKILAPTMVGVVLQYAAHDSSSRVLVGAVLLGGFHAVAWPLEVLCANAVYAAHEGTLEVREHRHEDGTTHAHKHGIREHFHREHLDSACEQLHHDHDTAHREGIAHRHSEFHHEDHRHTTVEVHHPGEGLQELPTILLSARKDEAPVGCCTAFGREVVAAIDRVKLFFGHRVAGASVAYCFLYMTVIDNGSLMTAYLQWRGVPPSYLGASRGVGAVFGMGGTFLFPLVTGCFGGRFRQTGLVAVWLFWLLLLPSALSFLWYGESRISDYSVIGCMIISRVGLWMFDLAETQVMQEDVEPRHRATLNSVQTSLFQALFVLIQIGGLCFHKPQQFEALVYWSVLSVLCSAVIYTGWYLRGAGASSLAPLETPLAPNA